MPVNAKDVAIATNSSQRFPEPSAEYLRATEFLDFDTPSVREFAAKATRGTRNDIKRAVRLFYKVRDGILYDPYRVGLTRETYKASHVLLVGRGFCLPKTNLLVACARAVGIPAAIGLADVTVEGRMLGKRARRGGSFIVPQTADYVPPTMGEPVEIGDLLFRIKGEPVMVFREVSEPLNVKALIDALKAHASAQARPPRGLGVDALWRGSSESAGRRT